MTAGTPEQAMPGPSVPTLKLHAAAALARLPWTAAASWLERRLPNHVRIINYHGTPGRLADQFAKQVDHLLRRFTPANTSELGAPLANGYGSGPSLIITFDDGLESNYEVAAPILEQRGLRGVFAIVAAFPSVARDSQPRWFRERVRSRPNAEHFYDNDLYSMTWDQITDLVARGHMICSHAMTHEQLSAESSLSVIEQEVSRSKLEIEKHVGSSVVRGFCWPVSGDPNAKLVDEAIRRQYKFAFFGGTAPWSGGSDPYRIGRTNLEASWPLAVVDFQLSGLIEAKGHLARMAATAGFLKSRELSGRKR